MDKAQFPNDYSGLERPGERWGGPTRPGISGSLTVVEVEEGPFKGRYQIVDGTGRRVGSIWRNRADAEKERVKLEKPRKTVADEQMRALQDAKDGQTESVRRLSDPSPVENSATRQEEKSIDQAKVIAVDLNRTLAQGGGPDDFGEPTDGAADAMRELRDRGYTLFVNSVVGDVDRIDAWLREHGMREYFDEINVSPAQPDDANPGKQNAAGYIDDRAIPYRGDWRQTLDDLYASGVLDKSLVIANEKSLTLTEDRGYVMRRKAKSLASAMDEVGVPVLCRKRVQAEVERRMRYGR